jgi:hypothetical protein
VGTSLPGLDIVATLGAENMPVAEVGVSVELVRRLLDELPGSVARIWVSSD